MRSPKPPYLSKLPSPLSCSLLACARALSHRSLSLFPSAPPPSIPSCLSLCLTCSTSSHLLSPRSHLSSGALTAAFLATMAAEQRCKGKKDKTKS
eukprot:4822946-Pleurochrysis_carterae.AAC.3